jgi:predicted dehydrogenase
MTGGNDMAEKVRVGIIGVGQIGKAHVQRYGKIADAEIVAVADINEVEARRVAEANGIPNVYTNFRDLLARDDIVAVDVCLHNNFHMPVTVAALEAGKHVYCEKPMAGTYCDAETMYRTAKEFGRKLHIQVNTLYAKETRAAKALIDGGHLGKIYHARSTGWRRRGRPYVDGYGTPTFVQKRNSAGGAMYDMGVYHIVQVLYLLGNPVVERVSGKICQETPMDPARREISGYDVEELGMGLVRFQDGLTMDFIEAWAINLNRFEGSYVVGSEGGIRLEPFGYFRSIGDLDLDSTVDFESFLFRLHMLRANEDAYDTSEIHWVAALQGRVPLIPSAQIALNTMLISEGVYLSDRLGREVTADEIRAASKSTAIML